MTCLWKPRFFLLFPAVVSVLLFLCILPVQSLEQRTGVIFFTDESGQWHPDREKDLVFDRGRFPREFSVAGCSEKEKGFKVRIISPADVLVEDMVRMIPKKSRINLFRYPGMLEYSSQLKQVMKADYAIIVQVTSRENRYGSFVRILDLVSGEVLQLDTVPVSEKRELMGSIVSLVPRGIEDLAKRSSIPTASSESGKYYHHKDSRHLPVKGRIREFSSFTEAGKAKYLPCPICFPGSARGLLRGSQDVMIDALVRASVHSVYSTVVDPVIQRDLDRVGLLLLEKTALKDMNFRFIGIDSGVVRICSSPGGTVYVTRRLFDLTESDDELAGVLSLELVSVLNRRMLADMSFAGSFTSAGSEEKSHEGSVPGMSIIRKHLEKSGSALDTIRREDLAAASFYMYLSGFDPRELGPVLVRIQDYFDTLSHTDSGKKRESGVSSQEFQVFAENCRAVSDSLKKSGIDEGIRRYILRNPSSFVQDPASLEAFLKDFSLLQFNKDNGSTNPVSPPVSTDSKGSSLPEKHTPSKGVQYELIPLDDAKSLPASSEGVKPPEALNQRKQ